MILRRRLLNKGQLIVVIALTLAWQVSCRHEARQQRIPVLLLTSSSFSANTIPAKYGCRGQNTSPEISWRSAPAGTQTFVLLVTDKDALSGSESGPFVHWVLFNISGDKRELPEGIPPQPKLPDGSFQGRNDFENIGYGGPCPPGGATHRYAFALYALDSKLNLSAGATEEQVEKAMEVHILARGEIIASY
jgi:Raf kinase inhibitor-like YbhB/YbcL family protein